MSDKSKCPVCGSRDTNRQYSGIAKGEYSETRRCSVCESLYTAYFEFSYSKVDQRGQE